MARQTDRRDTKDTKQTATSQMDDDLNQPTTETAFLKANAERRQLEHEIKSLLADLESADPDSLTELANRLKALTEKRKRLQTN